ncbi:hypothetical protein CR513_02441, partial [Mucuna pruriens]
MLYVSFGMKDLEESSFALGIKIYRDRLGKLLGLMLKAVQHGEFVVDSLVYAQVYARLDLFVVLGDGAISWKSVDQTLTTFSTMHANH